MRDGRSTDFLKQESKKHTFIDPQKGFEHNMGVVRNLFNDFALKTVDIIHNEDDPLKILRHYDKTSAMEVMGINEEAYKKYVTLADTFSDMEENFAEHAIAKKSGNSHRILTTTDMWRICRQMEMNGEKRVKALPRYEGKSHVIAFTSNKGGVGKTSIALAIATAIAEKEIKRGGLVLFIDLDHQANATKQLEFDSALATAMLKDEDYETALSLMMRYMRGESLLDSDYGDALVRTRVENLDLLPAHRLRDKLAVAEFPALHNKIINHLKGPNAPENDYQRLCKEHPESLYLTLLKGVIERYKNEFDYIIIDTPPQHSQISNLVFAAATEIVVPIIPSVYEAKTSVDMIDEYLVMYNSLKNDIEKGLISEKRLRFLLNERGGATNASKRFKNEIYDELKKYAFNKTLRSSTVIEQLASIGSTATTANRTVFRSKFKTADLNGLTNNIAEITDELIKELA